MEQKNKFLLRDVTSSSVISNLNRAGHAGVGGQMMRLQALLKKEVATSSIIQEGAFSCLASSRVKSCFCDQTWNPRRFLSVPL